MFQNYTPNSAGYIGEIRQAPNGQLYQLGEVVDGVGNYGLAWCPVNTAGMSGLGGLADAGYPPPQLGEIRRGPDGMYYQYTMDGLGNVGFAPLLALASKALPFVASYLPGIVNAVSGLFGGGSSSGQQNKAPGSGINVDELISKLAALLNSKGRSLAGLSDDDSDLMGYGDDLDLMGLADADDQDLMGFADDQDLTGLADDDDDLRGLADEDPAGMEGYFTSRPENLEGYVRGYPPENPRYEKRTTQPDMWRPSWE